MARFARRQIRIASTLPAVGPLAGRVEERISRGSPRPFPLADVLRVVDCLERDGMPFWIGGGWGVDALVGGQTRFHTDLEVVVEDPGEARHRLEKALSGLGFRSGDEGEVGAWWREPRLELQRADGLLVEALSIDWGFLDLAAQTLVPGSDASASRDGFFAEGEFGGRPVPCLSRATQTLFHRGYTPRPSDLWDLDLLSSLAPDDSGLTPSTPPVEGSTSLILPVFDLPPAAFRIWWQLNPPTATPHLTVMHPFLPYESIDGPARQALRSRLARVPPFDFKLERVGRFDRVVFLSPDRPQPFVDLTEAVSSEFPSVAPYEGAFDEVVPHLTIATGQPPSGMRQAATMSAHLPIAARAEEVWLVSTSSGRLLERFPLGRARCR